MKTWLVDVGRQSCAPLGRLLIVVTGIVAAQGFLYAPSLIGAKILLPLDLLAPPGVYLPQTAAVRKIVPHDVIMTDSVYEYEPNRRFAVSEIQAGRFPLWIPSRFAGVPCCRTCYFALPWLLNYFIASPVVLAWSQVLVSLVAGVGAYLFFRGVLNVGFWPAAIVAWCYPLTASYTAWTGHGVPPVACWLPWMLLAADKMVRRPWGWGMPALGILTGLLICGGQTDTAGQTLLACGIYVLWCYGATYGKQWLSRQALSSLACAVLAWSLGFMLAAWLLLPQLEYAQTGSRYIRRSQGEEERPPVGLAAIPQVVLPGMYGFTLDGSLRIVAGNVPESSVGAYCGMLATLLVAPLAWCSRKHRSINALWLLLGFVGLSWAMNVPGLVTVLRLPGLNMLSHNRFVFVTAFAILALAAVGLDQLWQGNVSRRWWFLLPLTTIAILCGWCIYRTMVLPEIVATTIGSVVSSGRAVAGIHDLAGVQRVQQSFTQYYAIAAALSALGVAGWCLLWFRVKLGAWFAWTVGATLVAELLQFGYGYIAQCDPALYYTPIPALEKVAQSAPGRIIGYQCFPPDLSAMQNLCDIRGYDGVDPARLIDLTTIAADPRFPNPMYALTQWLVPKILALEPPGSVRLHPVLDMLNVRYVIFRGNPPPGLQPEFAGDDYWVLTNRAALPRVFVPERVEYLADTQERLRRIAAADFDARRVAYVESPTELPPRCAGSARITAENPTQVSVSARMETPGLVVLADLWDNGWRAYLDGQPVPILRANHAIRGVRVPAGNVTLEFRYQPASFAWGLRVCGLAMVVLLGWTGGLCFFQRRPRKLSKSGNLK